MHEADDEAGVPLECRRTLFLETVLDDQEHDRLAPLDLYLTRFPEIGPFVRAEYEALFAEREPGEGLTGSDTAPSNCGRYRITSQLGEGGMGVVHEAWDPELSRRVVVKTLRSGIADTMKARERLKREARVLGRLDHPSLAKIIDVVETDGRIHLVMPYYEGRVLSAAIAEARATSEASGSSPTWPRLDVRVANGTDGLRAIIAFFARAAQALHSAHGAGVVHRDLKPANMLVAPDASPVVLDFGLALPISDDRLTQAGDLLGTPLYMAPEQIEGGEPDARTDVYALGVTLYETLGLVHPFAGPAGRAAVFHRILHKEPVPLRRHQPRVPRDLEAVVQRAMDRQPRRRYSDMAAFARELQRVLDYEPTEARPVSGLGQVWRRVRRRPAIALLVTVAIGAIAFAGRSQWLLDCDWNRDAVNDAMLALDSAQGITDPNIARNRAIEALRRVRHVAIAQGPRPLHPCGTVRSVAAFAWEGMAVRDEREPNIRFHYEYAVELSDAAGKPVARWGCEQPDEIVCRTALPAGVVLEPGSYRWVVTLERVQAVGEGACDAAVLEQCKRMTVADVVGTDPGFGVAASFTIAALPAGMPSESAGPEARAAWLIEQGFATDALVLLDGETAQGIPPERLADLVQRAVELLDAAMRSAAEPSGTDQPAGRR